MAYLAIDDKAYTHPKLLAVSDRAFRLWFSGNCYCQQYLTDGVIAAAVLPTLPGFSKATLGELLTPYLPGKNPLWKRLEDGSILVHDFLAWNRSKEQITEAHAIKRTRRELFGSPDLIEKIRARDKNLCRYCGQPVSWRDRKSPSGGTYDHVDPAGGNSLDNVVTACRGCSSSKGRRTPEQAGMRVRPTPDQVPEQIGNKSKSSTESRSGSALTTSTSSSSSDRDPRGTGAPLVGRRNPRVLNDADPVQFPSTLSTEFQAVIAPKLAAGADTYTALLAWVHEVSDRTIAAIGAAPKELLSDPFRWWRSRLAEDWSADPQPPAGPKSCRRGHQPPCPDDVACTRRYLAELEVAEARG